MILCFPDFDTLRLTITGGLLPTDMLQAPALLGELPQGGYAVETSGKLPKKAATELAKLNVTGSKTMPGISKELSCWYQILPLVKEPAGVPLATQTPVLFELESPADLTALVGEMLRLGNDRQSFRWMRDAGSQKILLRVIGPPYYTMLRAIDQLPTDAGGHILAYIEQAPRFWVQLGYRHPLSETLQVPIDRCVLVRPERDWKYLAEAPFRDAYEILDFQLPEAPTDWQPVQDVPKFEVPLTLAPGNATDAAELWVFRGDALAQLDAFVRDSEERLIQRLRFAAAEGDAGESRIVLRVAPSKLALPVLALPGGLGFKPYQKLPNLFLPVGRRLHPQLRRDAVRGLLAADTNRCSWLMPGENGIFTPESVAEDAFRPLEDWVEYQISLAQEPLKAWIGSLQFDFQSFQCSETGAPRPKAPPDNRSNSTETSPSSVRVPSASKDRKTATVDSVDSVTEAQPFTPETKAPNEWHKLRLKLQSDFLNTSGSLDSAEKKALWPALARANAGAGDTHEAALCWLSAMWEYERPPQLLVDGWRTSEGLNVPGWNTPAKLESLLGNPNPAAAEVRRFASLFFALATQSPPPDWLKPKLLEVQRYSETFDAVLPIRAAWIVGVQLARLAGGDALGLARLRDRLLERLIEQGLNREIDLPFFLRNSESEQSETMRFIRAKTAELHQCISKWSESATVAPTVFNTRNNAQTSPYIDLLFAYALARLGESRTARTLVEQARVMMTATANDPKFGIASDFLFRAFLSRVETAISAKPNQGPLDSKLRRELEEMYRQSANIDNSPQKMAFYVISRMREESRILEPLDRIATYEKLGNIDSEFKKFEAIHDGSVLAAEIRKIVRTFSTRDIRYQVTLLKVALPLAHRAGESFVMELLQQIPKVIDGEGEPDNELLKMGAQVLEHGLFLAAHYDRRDFALKLLDLFQSSFERIHGDNRFEYASMVVRHCLKALRRLGLHEEGQRFLDRVQTHLLKQQSMEQWRDMYATDPKRWGTGFQALLALAGGQLRFSRMDRGLPVLDAARNELLARTTKLPPKDFTALAQAYIAACGQAEPEFGLARITELFEKMNPALVTVTYTTAAFYSRLHLNLVEETVLAITGDDSAFGATGQRWLEDDEYIVRRQIHRDMKWLLHHAGA